MSAAAAAKFDDWNLAEADIAEARGTSQGTVRQQVQAIYRKPGLTNRSELAAIILEDVFDMAAARTPCVRATASSTSQGCAVGV